MKTLLSSKSLFAAVAVVAVAGLGYFAMQSPAETNFPASASTALPQPQAAVDQTPIAPPAPAPQAPPPNILPSSPLAQVIRLAQAGLDQSILMAYVTNSSSTFNLDSGKIIYATDAGVPAVVVTAMMQRDQQLQQTMTAPPPQSPQAPSTSAPPPATAPITSDVSTEPDVPVTINYFYTTLSPYGAWVDVPGYGTCWRPNVAVYDAGWAPYCDRGYWAYTDCGWYWYSDYSWGCTFHYGRWFRDPRWGWCWWPDTVWGPSWVTWRYSDDYCGWAPLPPFATWQSGVGFCYHGNGVSVGFDFGLTPDCFVFVPSGSFCNVHLRTCRVPLAQTTVVFNRTTVINNININAHRTIVNAGIGRQFIAQATHRQIEETAVRNLRKDYYQHVNNARQGTQAAIVRDRATAADYVDQRIQNINARQQQRDQISDAVDNAVARQQQIQQNQNAARQNVISQSRAAANAERQAIQDKREQLQQQVHQAQERQAQAVERAQERVQQQIQSAKNGQGQGNGNQGNGSGVWHGNGGQDKK